MSAKQQIIEKLKALAGGSIFVNTLRAECETNFDGCLEMVLQQARDPRSRNLLVKVIGEDLVTEIEQYATA